MDKSICIFIGGDAPRNNIISWHADCVLAADAGLDICKQWNIVPDVVLGDFDSVSREEIEHYAPKAEIIQHPSKKDYSDTYLAVEYAHIHNYSDITLVGGIGQRLDHFIALLMLFTRDTAPNRLIGPAYQFERLYAEHSIDCTHIADRYISFFSLSASTTQRTSGLLWDLTGLELTKEQHSLSNEYTSDTVIISMHTGSVLGVWAHGNAPQIVKLIEDATLL